MHHPKNHFKLQRNARLQLPQHAGTSADDENAANFTPAIAAAATAGRSGCFIAKLGCRSPAIHDTADGCHDAAVSAASGRSVSTGSLDATDTSDAGSATSSSADSGTINASTANAGSTDVAVSKFSSLVG
jgi:hypothetical protein